MRMVMWIVQSCLKSMYELDEAKNREGRKGPMAGTGWDVDDGR